MTKRIALLGGPSSGKSTLAAALFSTMKEIGINADLVQEYAREHINKYGAPENVLTQFLIYKKQREKEDILPKQVEYIITDSPTILSYVYGLYYYDPKSKDHRIMLADMYYEMMLDGFSRYQYVFFLEATRPYKLDGTRTQSAQEAKQIGLEIKELLRTHKIPFSTLEMPETQKRVTQILEEIDERYCLRQG